LKGRLTGSNVTSSQSRRKLCTRSGRLHFLLRSCIESITLQFHNICCMCCRHLDRALTHPVPAGCSRESSSSAADLYLLWGFDLPAYKICSPSLLGNQVLCLTSGHWDGLTVAWQPSTRISACQFQYPTDLRLLAHHIHGAHINS
jgi:hypothetical protein